MIVGLDVFSKHFADYTDQYVLIGGSALVLAMEEAGLRARGTKDLDIVLCLEALTPEFVAAFWEFVELGQYDVKERSDEDRSFYRFKNPKADGYPKMLEIFSRKPDALAVPEGCHLTPIPVGKEGESHSAILLDDDYYAFLHSRKEILNGVPVVDEVGLIGLKAHAWLKLSADREARKQVDQKNIKKHQSDIFRLYNVIPEGPIEGVPDKVKENVDTFLRLGEKDIDLKALELPDTILDQVAADIRKLLGITEPTEAD